MGCLPVVVNAPGNGIRKPLYGVRFHRDAQDGIRLPRACSASTSQIGTRPDLRPTRTWCYSFARVPLIGGTYRNCPNSWLLGDLRLWRRVAVGMTLA